VEVGEGAHEWTYELPIRETPAFDLDSPVGEIVKFPEVWKAAFAAMLHHLPFLKDFMDESTLSVGSQAKASLRWMLGQIPGNSPQLEADVHAALRSHADLNH
jgi:hypothetical protein